MAERLENYKFRGIKEYPWDDWCDGSIWKIFRGEDYDVLPSSMRAQLGVRAKKLGMKVRTNQLQRVLVFQFFNDEEDE